MAELPYTGTMLLSKMRLDRSKPIRMEAADLVQEAILTGHFQPGDEVPQLKLAQQLGLSQSSVREALQELEHRGLLERKGRSRTIISLTEDDLACMYQLRGVLEPMACRLAAEHWSGEVSDRLEECLTLMEKAARANKPLEHVSLDLEFHRLIWRSQPNRHLEKHLQMLCMPLFAYELVQRSEVGLLNFRRTLQQHQFILAALRTRDGVRAERVVRRLIDRFHRFDLADYRRLRTDRTAVSLPG